MSSQLGFFNRSWQPFDELSATSGRRGKSGKPQFLRRSGKSDESPQAI